MWCLRGYYFKMAPGTVKKAIEKRTILNERTVILLIPAEVLALQIKTFASNKILT